LDLPLRCVVSDCRRRRKIPRTKRCLHNIQHNPRKLRRGSTSRRSTSAWKSCHRNSRASSPWHTSSGVSLAYRRTPSSAWAYRTRSHPGSRVRPTWWPHGPCSACRFEIFCIFLEALGGPDNDYECDAHTRGGVQSPSRCYVNRKEVPG
jgi:hypothetical protein